VLCCVAMFGMGASEILVILVVALLFLGPEKLPEAASKISKGIRDLRRQTRELSQTIENDTQIGGAIRDLKSALRGDEPRPRPVPRPVSPEVAAAAAAIPPPDGAQAPIPGDPAAIPPPIPGDPVAIPAPVPPPIPGDATPRIGAPDPVEAAIPPPAPRSPTPPPSPREPRRAGEPAAPAGEGEAGGDAEVAGLIRPASGTVAKGGPS
jgi:sec-independent protein translocase protein TatB